MINAKNEDVESPDLANGDELKVLEDTDVEMLSVRSVDEVEEPQVNDERVVALMMCISVVVVAAKEMMNIVDAENRANHDRSFQRSLDRLRVSLDENFESFGSEGASVVGEIFELLDEVDAEQSFANVSDPDIEEMFASMVDEVVNNPGQISEQINSKISGLERSLNQGSFDKIGGKGTLREIWARLKRLHMVSGVKRKLEERDWESFGQVGPMGDEELGSSGWSSYATYMQRLNQVAEGPSSDSNTSGSLPSLASSGSITTGSSDSQGWETSGGSVVSLLRRNFEQVAVSGGKIRVQMNEFVDDQVMIVEATNDDDEQHDDVFEDGAGAPAIEE